MKIYFSFTLFMFSFFNGLYKKLKFILYNDKYKKAYGKIIFILRKTTPLDLRDIEEIQKSIYILHPEKNYVKKKFRHLKDAIEYKKKIGNTKLIKEDVSYVVGDTVIKGKINSSEEEKYFTKRIIDQFYTVNDCNEKEHTENNCIKCLEKRIRLEVSQKIELDNIKKEHLKNKKRKLAIERNLNKLNIYNERLGLGGFMGRIIGKMVGDEYFNPDTLDSEEYEAYKEWEKINKKIKNDQNSSTLQNPFMFPSTDYKIMPTQLVTNALNENDTRKISVITNNSNNSIHYDKTVEISSFDKIKLNHDIDISTNNDKIKSSIFNTSDNITSSNINNNNLNVDIKIDNSQALISSQNVINTNIINNTMDNKTNTEVSDTPLKAINNIENKPIENMGFTKEGNNNTLSIIENEEVKSSSLFENKIKTPFNSNIFSNNNLNNKPSSLNILSHDDNNNTKSINYTVDNTQNNLFNINSNNQTNIISNNDKISEQINFNFSFKNPFQENTVSHSNPLPFSSQPNTSSIITESGQTMKKRAKRRRD